MLPSRTAPKEQVRFTSRGAMLLMPDGEGGIEITLPPGADVRVNLEDGDGGALEYWTIVEHLDGSAADGAEAALARWRARGFPEARSIQVHDVEQRGHIGQSVTRRLQGSPWRPRA